MMKIAFPTDDGEKISAHLGQSNYFQVISVENGQIGGAELREKAHHNHNNHDHHGESGVHPGQQMIEVISDCDVLIAGGMGEPMFNRAKNQGMQVILTGEKEINQALDRFLKGDLTTDLRRIHQH